MKLCSASVFIPLKTAEAEEKPKCHMSPDNLQPMDTWDQDDSHFHEFFAQKSKRMTSG